MKTITIAAERVSVVEETGVDGAGRPTFQRWDCQGGQAGKHLLLWMSAEDRPKGIIGAKLSAGDAAAIQDQANEWNKQRKA